MRRLNVKLLLWLIGTSIVLVVGIFGLWRFQRSRTAGSLLVRADKFATDKNYIEALKEYDRYFKFRKDDDENYVRYALLHDEYARLPDATLIDKQRAITHMKVALVKDPSQSELKRKVIDQCIEFRAYLEAMPLLKELIEVEKDNAELEALLARCYVANNENDKAVEFYEKSLQHDPKRVATYVSLAEVQRSRLSKPEEAAKTLDLAIERNPDSAAAYLARARSVFEKDPAAAKADVEKALSLEPTNPDAVLLGTDTAIKDGDVELARRRIEVGREANPDETSLIITASKLESISDPKKAEEILNDGIRRLPKKVELLFTLSELQLDQGNLDGAKQTLDAMRKKEVGAPFLKYIEAQILAREGKYEPASRLLEEIRQVMARTQWATQINTLLAQCYRNQGRSDRELASAQVAYQQNPESTQAKLALALAFENNRQRTEALKIYRTMLDNPAIQLKVGQMMIHEMADRTERERNWDEVDTFLKDIRAKGAPELACNLLDAQVLKHRGQGAEAVALLEKNRDAHPDQPQTWLALYEMTKEEVGKDQAAAVLASAIQKFGRTPELDAVSMRDSLIVQTGEDTQKAAEQLKSELSQMDEKQKLQSLGLLAERALRAGKLDEARDYYLQVQAIRPKEPSILLALFQVARIGNNVSDMTETVQKIRDLRGPNSFEYLFTASALEITKLLQEVEKSGQAPAPDKKPLMIQIRQQLQAAEQIRSNNPDLAQLDGELAQLEGDLPRAIDAYRKASTGSMFSPLMSKRLVQLLATQGKYSEALSELERLNPEVIERMELAQVQAELLAKTDKQAEALPIVDKIVANKPDWRKHLWAARMYDDADKSVETERELRAAAEGAPAETIDPYLVLVEFLVKKKGDPTAAVAVLEQAKQKIDPKELPLLLAKGYESLNDVELARRNFEQALAAQPDDLRAIGGAVGFYLRQNQTDDALAMLDKMINTALSSTNQRDRENAAWARRIKAQFLGKTGRYQDTLEAIALIDQSEKDGLASADDLSLKASLLSNRADRKSRLEAKEIFEKLIPMREDSSGERFALAKIYEREGDWNRARSEFLSALGQRSNDPRMIYEFCQTLLRHNEIGDVPRWLTRLEEVAPDAKTQANEIRGRMAAVQGKKKDAADLLNSLIARPVTADRAMELIGLANIFNSLSMVDEEEKAYREFYTLKPEEHLVLAGFLARNGQISEVMDLCQKARAANREPTAITQVAIGAVQSQPGAAREQDYKLIEGWIQEGIAKDPKSAVLQTHLGDFRYGQGRYDEAEKIYRELLARPEAVGPARANTLNNLAFVISLRDKGSPEKLKEAQQMIDEAIAVVGPISELIDTRGMVALARGDTAEALKDLNDACADRPSGIKLFHLALAQQATGDLKGADASFRKAREMGFTKEHVTSLEMPAYNALEKALVGR